MTATPAATVTPEPPVLAPQPELPPLVHEWSAVPAESAAPPSELGPTLSDIADVTGRSADADVTISTVSGDADVEAGAGDPDVTPRESPASDATAPLTNDAPIPRSASVLQREDASLGGDPSDRRAPTASTSATAELPLIAPTTTPAAETTRRAGLGLPVSRVADGVSELPDIGGVGTFGTPGALGSSRWTPPTGDTDDGATAVSPVRSPSTGSGASRLGPPARADDPMSADPATFLEVPIASSTAMSSGLPVEVPQIARLAETTATPDPVDPIPSPATVLPLARLAAPAPSTPVATSSDVAVQRAAVDPTTVTPAPPTPETDDGGRHAGLDQAGSADDGRYGTALEPLDLPGDGAFAAEVRPLLTPDAPPTPSAVDTDTPIDGTDTSLDGTTASASANPAGPMPLVSAGPALDPIAPHDAVGGGAPDGEPAPALQLETVAATLGRSEPNAEDGSSVPGDRVIGGSALSDDLQPVDLPVAATSVHGVGDGLASPSPMVDGLAVGEPASAVIGSTAEPAIAAPDRSVPTLGLQRLELVTSHAREGGGDASAGSAAMATAARPTASPAAQHVGAPVVQALTQRPPAASAAGSETPGDVAVRHGMADRDANGAVVFRLPVAAPSHIVSAPVVSSPAAPPSTDAAGSSPDGANDWTGAGPEDDGHDMPSIQLAAASAAGTPSTAAGAAAAGGSGGGGQSPADLDELARRLYGRIRVHLRHELRLDRERAGVLVEGRR